MLTKTNCFAYRGKNDTARCNALNDNAAHCECCSFYKTVEENQRQAEAAKERLVTLGANEGKRKRKMNIGG